MWWDLGVVIRATINNLCTEKKSSVSGHVNSALEEFFGEITLEVLPCSRTTAEAVKRPEVGAGLQQCRGGVCGGNSGWHRGRVSWLYAEQIVHGAAGSSTHRLRRSIRRVSDHLHSGKP